MKNIILWILSIFMILMSFVPFSEGGVISGLLILLSGMTCNPMFLKKLEKMGKKPAKGIVISIVACFFFIGILTSPVASESDSTESATVVEQDGTDDAAEPTEIKVVSDEKEAAAEVEKTEANTTSAKVKTTEVKVKEVVAKVDDSIVDSELQVHFIDVGQGDSTLIICDGHAMLIDAGDNNKGTAIQLYLTKQGVKKLDYVIGTHPDADHIGGLDVILYKFDCSTIMMPDFTKDSQTYDDVIQTMKSKSYLNTLPIVGATYQLGDAEFTIIAPNGSYSDANNSSVGILLSHGENTFLFTGDAEEEAEDDILKNGISIDADVYQVGHHGSKTASSQDLLDAVTPTYAVISCGEGNSYGHPQSATLNNLRSMGVKVFRTDEQGSIIATSNGSSITWNCSPSETWQAGEATESAKTSTATSDTTTTVKKETTPAKTETTPVVIQEAPQTVEIASTTTYVLNTNTLKFHYPTCSSVSQMKESNKQEVTISRDEVIAMGYVPCKNCNP